MVNYTQYDRECFMEEGRDAELNRYLDSLFMNDEHESLIDETY
jgi:hypothetical protein